MGEVILTFRQLEKACKLWKKRLGLHDWRIALKIVRRWDIDGNIARTNYSLERSDATVSLSDPIDYEGYPIPYDMEQTLVHELYHLVFSTVYDPQTESERIDWERLIEKQSWCMVNGWRQDEPE